MDGLLIELGDDAAVKYWDQGIDEVPRMTGAAAVMDSRDLVDACERLGVLLPLAGRVLDVGCGTARWQRFCFAYIGLDINPSAVAYAQRAGVTAHLIEGYGPAALDGWLGGAEWVCCFSVFTHIDRDERVDYLRSFHRIAPSLLVDIIPGDGQGDIPLWTAKIDDFEQDAVAIGWRLAAVAERVSPDGVCHRYYRCER